MKMILRLTSLSLLAFSALHAVDAKPVRPKPEPNPALLPIEEVVGLPWVLLLRDSVLIRYTLPMRKLLEGNSNVHRPADKYC